MKVANEISANESKRMTIQCEANEKCLMWYRMKCDTMKYCVKAWPTVFITNRIIGHPSDQWLYSIVADINDLFNEKVNILIYQYLM